MPFINGEFTEAFRPQLICYIDDAIVEENFKVIS